MMCSEILPLSLLYGRHGDPLKLWFNVSTKVGRDTRHIKVYFNSSTNTDPRCKKFWDLWNR